MHNKEEEEKTKKKMIYMHAYDGPQINWDLKKQAERKLWSHNDS